MPVGALYTALGEAIHRGGRKLDISNDPVSTHRRAAEVHRPRRRPWPMPRSTSRTIAYIRAETDLVFERAGKDVGTPVITFHPGQPDEASFFGPVISSIPRGDAALKLWDAVEVVATTSCMAELKRSNRSKPVFD